MPSQLSPRQRERRVVRRRADHDDELLNEAASEPATSSPSVVALQRQLGNAGVQRLLKSGGIRQVAGADMVHRKGCSCAACSGIGAERVQRSVAPQIQRFWGDDEEESSGDSGGSVWDSISDTASSAWNSVSETASDVGSAVGGAASSAWDAASDAAGSAWDSASEAAGGAWDTVSEAAGGAWGAVSDAAGSAWGAVSDAAGSAWGAVSDAAGGAWDTAKEVAGGLWDDVTGGGSKDEDEKSGDEEEEEDVDLPRSGTVEAIKGSRIGMGSGCDLPFGTPHPRHFRQSPRHRPRPQPENAGKPYKVNAHITMVEHNGEQAPVESSFTALDMPTSFKVGSNLDFGSQTEAGGIGIPGEAFGYSAPTITVDNIKWTLDPASATIGIFARIHVWVNWKIRSNDKTDINTGNEDLINANNWEYIIRDLKPETGGGQPARGVYYSSTVTVKHELFHANEYIASARGQIPAMSSYLAEQVINLPEDRSADYPSVIGGKVSSIMGDVRDKVEKAVKAKYDSGGEDRAYADGKGDYNGIIANIEKRARSKGWPKNLSTP